MITEGMSLMENDQELYELSYEVNVRTGWTMDTPWGFTDGVLTYGDFYQNFKLLSAEFILDKLPNSIDITKEHSNLYVVGKLDSSFADHSVFDYGENYKEESDTLLKALLKFVIALGDGGEKI